MAKNNGALFSKALFGYKKSSVNEYIRQFDEKHTDEIAKLKDDILRLENRAVNAENLAKELESELSSERASAAANIQKLTEASSKKLADAEKARVELSVKLADSEARATSYLKLADSSSLRADSAEAEVSSLKAELENARAEIEELQKNRAADTRKISDLEKRIAVYSIQQEAGKAEHRVSKRPSLMRIISRK